MLLSNAIALGLMQGVNYIFPLLTVPYLVRVLGVENFGLLGFATALVAYFALLTDYGFNVSATRRIAQFRDNKALRSEIFNTVLGVKVILACFSFLALFFLVNSFDKLNEHALLYLLSFGVVIGQVLFPLWFFLGMEEMHYIPRINVVSKTIFTLSIFLFIHSEQDLLLVPLLVTLEAFLSGLYAFYVAVTKFEIDLYLPTIQKIKKYLFEGKHVFISSLGINAYKTNAVLVLGVLSSPLMVGYFVIAKKLYDALGGINSIIHQVFLPYISRVQNGRTNISPEIRNLFRICFISSSLLLLMTVLFADQAVLLISGEEIVESVHALYFFAIALFMVGMNIPAAIYLLQSHHDKAYSKAILLGALLDIVLLFTMIPLYGIYGAMIAVACTETSITILLYLYAGKVYKHAKL